MDVKVAGRQFKRVESRQAGDLKRALDRRTKVKVSALLSPESQQAILMVREETVQDRYFHFKPDFVCLDLGLRKVRICTDTAKLVSIGKNWEAVAFSSLARILGRTFDYSFLACGFFFLKWRLARAHKFRSFV